VITIRSPLNKTLILITLTTLTIGLGASASFNQPTKNVHDASVLIAANDFDRSTDYVELEYEGPDGDSGTIEMEETESSSGNWSYNFNKDGDADESQGDYVFTAQGYESSSADSETVSTDSKTVLLDASRPDVELSEDSEFVESNHEFVYDVSDDYSDIDSVDVSADSNDGDVEVDVNEDCSGESNCEVDVDIDAGDLDNGDEFSVDVEATDEAGNIGGSDDSFTVDSSYDGDSSADVEWVESGDSVLNGFGGEDQDLSIFFEPDSVSDTSFECFVDGEGVDSDSLSPSDDEEEAVCEFDHDDYSGDLLDLTVEVEDETGNGETLVDGEELVWDTSSPSISSLEQSDGISRFNSGFDLSLSASDDASGIDLVEYYFDANTDVGEGNEVSFDDSGDLSFDQGFDVDTGDLGKGNHSVYVRVVDGQDKQSVESFDFEYYPGRDPDVELDASESIEVTSGESSSFDLSIGNEAPFFVERIEVSSEDGMVWNGSKEALNLENGDDVVKTVSIDASGLEPGVYELDLVADGYAESITVEVVVRANENQRTGIDSSLSDWLEKRDELEENVSSIGTASPSDMKEFNDSMTEAEELVANNSYYKAKQVLDSINSSYSEARQNYSERLEEHNTNQRNLLIGAILFFVLVGGGAGGYIVLKGEDSEKLDELVPEEFKEYIPDEIIPENIELPGQVEEFKTSLEESELGERVKKLFEGEEDKKDVGYSFDDFN